MVAAGVVTNYAVFGAVAQMRYTEAVLTEDADIMIALPSSTSLNPLGPVYQYCQSRGLMPRGRYIQIGDWPVQFR
jgi:hypothetical protein